MIPRSIQEAAAALDTLPGIGPRAALRYAYWLAGQSKDAVRRLTRSFEALADGSARHCSICGTWADASPCAICADPRRDQTVLCIVATSQDVEVIEASGAFKGRYHVLGGLVDTIEGKTGETLNIASLSRRLSGQTETIHELVLALDPDVAGDATALYVANKLAGFSIILTRLARGLQHGAQIEYADGVTIADALQNRKNVSRG